MATTVMDRSEPLSGALFRVEIDGVNAVAALEVVFPESRIVTEDGRSSVRHGSLTLRRALTESPDWYQWWDRARTSHTQTATQTRPVSRTVSVILMDRAGADRQRWTFSNAVPIAYSVSPLNALSSAPVVESLELAVGGFDAASTLS
jgi:phage tail-like protein